MPVRERARGQLCLECRVGAGVVLVPAIEVERLAEYVVGAPPPGAPRYVAGIGSLDDEVVLSLSLVPHPRARRREVHGLLLVRAHGEAPRWALEVAASASFVRVDDEPVDPPPSSSHPPWLQIAVADGARRPFVDVHRMVRCIASGEEGR